MSDDEPKTGLNFLAQSQSAQQQILEGLLDEPAYLRRQQSMQVYAEPKEGITKKVTVAELTDVYTQLYHWADEPPNQEGWYWNKGLHKWWDDGWKTIYDPAVIVYVFKTGTSTFRVLDPSGKHSKSVVLMVGDLWAGPIPEPLT